MLCTLGRKIWILGISVLEECAVLPEKGLACRDTGGCNLRMPTLP